jgi:hypothetical protein
MDDIRATFLATGRAVAALFDHPSLAARWDDHSALAEFSVRGLAGHLSRAVGSVNAYLDRDEPPADDVITAAHYYGLAVGDDTDVTSPLHTAIRQRGEEAAADGVDGLRKEFDALLDGMATRLADEPPTRRIRVYQDLVLTLDDYLVTRLIEMTVHMDDLAVSLDVPTPALPEAAADAAIHTLVDVARARGGDTAVLRALTRRERADAGTLHVL